MDNEDRDIHKGHRQRMRRKFADYSARPFDTYELLEMLLYNVIPYKDTNPVSKKLLSHFGSLDAVLSAEPTELITCDGVGEAAATLIGTVGELTSDEGASLSAGDVHLVFDDRGIAGNFITDYFSGIDGYAVAAMLLDNRMRLINITTLYNVDYSSGAVRAERFMEYALKHRASAIIIAHTHPHGPLYPSHEDAVTNDMVATALASVGVGLIEHFVVMGNSFVGTMGGVGYRAIGGDEKLGHRGEMEMRRDRSRMELLLEKLLAYAVREPELAAYELIVRYGDMTALAVADYDELCSMEHVGVAGAHLIRLVSVLRSRRVVDEFVLPRRFTEAEFQRYLSALFFSSPNEETYVFLVDDKGRVVFSELLGVGTVNSMSVIPRKIFELLLRQGCRRAILAHNHPSGRADASDEDLEATRHITFVLRNAQRELLAHYVVAGNDVLKIT